MKSVRLILGMSFRFHTYSKSAGLKGSTEQTGERWMSRRCRGVSGGTEDFSERAAVLRKSKQQLGISNLAGGQQPAFHNDEVGKGKQRVQLGGVLGQAAVAQLAMAEQVLDHVEGVLDPGSDLG